MEHIQNNDRQSVVEQVNDKPVIIDFGIRAICNLRFSKMVALPKIALAHCGGIDAKQIHVKLVQSNDEKYIRLEPVSTTQIEESTN